MDTLSFVATVILLTASGALAPGPLFFVTVSHGSRSGAKSGLVFSIAHTLVEFTLVMLLACGLLAVVNEPNFKPIISLIIGVAGGIVLLFFGAIQIRDSLTSKTVETGSGPVATRNLVLIGLAFTGLNPFFIFWWLTVGAKLILDSLEFASIAGVVFMYICHVWMDYAWLTSIAHLSKMGTNVVGFKWYRLIMAVFGAVLIYFGIIFLINSLGF
ncbi:MAG: LysE family translocator [Candidatus Bathyarchaeota archaeon]|nr:LysE family translocator [Candidatus Bathyarchaeota archaeon]